MSEKQSGKQTDHSENVQLPQGKSKPTLRASHSPTVGVREKLIIIFLFVKILPLILLTFIAWKALISLGTILRETAVVDSREALTAMAVENIERITTDTAQKVAEFLYQRDTDIAILARHCRFLDTDAEDVRQHAEAFFADFDASKTSQIRDSGNWIVGKDGMSWVQANPYTLPEETQQRSVNQENEELLDGATFRYRPPFGFGDDPNRFVRVPLYDEIALLDKNGMQIAKHVSPLSTKKRFPFPKELQNVSDPKNTFVRAERYFAELSKLPKDGIYVSDVIGAYVPSRFIGMYTPDFMASRMINAQIAELETEANPRNAETIWKLRVLCAELKNEEEKFNSRAEINKKIRDEIDRRLGHDNIWKIELKSLVQASDELRTLGFVALADKILSIEFQPEEEAFAGAENPLGIRFEGIIRWVKPVLDDNAEIVGYVTFALNHDHLAEMIDHVTPMPERYSELSDAFNGNYAFIWDYKCRSIVHPRHHSICGYNPETGLPETPWLEKTLYDSMIAAGYDRADWQNYIATLENYIPWTGNKDSLAYQSRSKSPALELTKLGLVGLDGRYLNNAPQCTGWMDLTRDGGSGSFYILWSGLYKLTTAAAIPYYTGQYSPEVQGNRRGFGFVTIGAGIDDFSRPANEMDAILENMVHENIQRTTFHLVWTTIVLSIVVIFIAIWMASYLSRKLQWLIDGITQFHSGKRNFRFATEIRDEFGLLAQSFDAMAENIVQSVHTPLVITDMDLNIIYANNQCLELLKHKTLASIVGQSYKEESIYRYGSEYCPITALLCGTEPSKVLYLKQTGKFLQGTANYFMDEHDMKRGYVITSNDVTEIALKQAELERAKEEAERANSHKSIFLSRMSHELRTPMNAMIGLNEITLSQLSKMPGLEHHQELSDFLEQLKTASLHLLNLLNDILEASNLESGTVTLVKKPMNLRNMLEEISTRTKSKCLAKKLELTVDFEELPLPYVVTDGLRLRQVLINLLDNAVKYTPERGQIEFIVRQKAYHDGRTFLSFVVRDTGIGIAQEGIKKIFHPFEQMVTEGTAYTSGSGLGLAIVRKILELFNSHIVVRSEVGKGSEFSFEIWLRNDNVVDKADFESLNARFVGQKALVVDDVRLNRLVLVNLLQDAGFIVDEASDGKEGFEMFQKSHENEYDIIFMDIQMPVMNGYESAVLIRKLPRQDSENIPIITISANAFTKDVDKSFASGMNAHYAKPIQKDILSEILLTYCTPTAAGSASGAGPKSNGEN